jgi:hypothetical protein
MARQCLPYEGPSLLTLIREGLQGVTSAQENAVGKRQNQVKMELGERRFYLSGRNWNSRLAKPKYTHIGILWMKSKKQPLYYQSH